MPVGIFRGDEQTVAAAGTAEALVASSLFVRGLTIRAKVTNGGNVYIGSSAVADTDNDGLRPNDSMTITDSIGFDLAEVFVDADTNGEGIDFWYTLS
jgi:hypothetical protein|tara:strand:+ start:2881 stop:3171 length:291 start_codon:yes stop_codon:yes gene_type:complete